MSMRTSGTPLPSPKADRWAYLRAIRSINAKFGRLGRRKRAPKPVYAKETTETALATPLWCAIHAGPRGAPAAAALLTHGAGHGPQDTAAALRDLVITALEHGVTDVAAPLLKLLGPAAATDGPLLAHFCSTGNAHVVRWLVERGVAAKAHAVRSGTTPIGAAAAAGHSSIVEFLLASGATANTSSGKDTPLLLAIASGHHGVVHQLVTAGAKLLPEASADGSGAAIDFSLSALVAAARRGDEPIVRSLIGSRKSATMVEAIPALAAALEGGPAHSVTKLHASERKPAQVCSHEAVAIALVDAAASTFQHEAVGGPQHPVELLHVAASKGYFRAAMKLAEALAALPTDTQTGLLDTAPLPDLRKVESVVPRSLQDASNAQARGNERRKKRGKTLHPAEKPFDRFVYSGSPLPDVPRHRQKLRDVFSFAAEAGERRLITILLDEVRLQPWSGPDLRGWNAADYALEANRLDVACAFLACGVVPCRYHGIGSGDARRFSASCSTVVRSFAKKVDAIDQWLPLALMELCRRGETGTIGVTLRALLRRHRLTDLAEAGPWTWQLLSAALAEHRGTVVECLLTEFNVSLATPPTVEGMKWGTSPLVSAILAGETNFAERLVLQNAPVDEVSQLDKAGIKRLLAAAPLPQAAFARDLPVTPLFAAAATGNVPLVRLLLSRGAPSAKLDRLNNGAVAAAIYGCGKQPSASRLAAAADIVADLVRAEAPYTNSELLLVATSRGAKRLAELLVECYGEGVVLKAIECRDGIDSPHTLPHLLISQGWSQLLMQLLEDKESYPEVGNAIAAADFGAHSPVASALRAGLPDVALALLSLGVALRPTPTLTVRPVSTVTARRSRDACSRTVHRILMAHNATFRNQRHGWTIVHAACAMNLPDILKAAIQRAPFAEVLRLAPAGPSSPLSLAMRHGDGQCVRVLLGHRVMDGVKPISGDSATVVLAAIINDSRRSVASRNFAGRDIDSWVSLVAKFGGNVTSPIPLQSTEAKGLLSSANRFVDVLAPRWGSSGTHTPLTATPITLASMLGDIDGVVALLSLGAKADCTASITTHSIGGNERRRARYGRSGRWVVSNDPESVEHVKVVGRKSSLAILLQQRRTVEKVREPTTPYPQPQTDGADNNKTFTLCPVVVAVAAVCSAARRVVAPSRPRGGNTIQQRAALSLGAGVVDLHSRIELLRVLLRGGGLRLDDVPAITTALGAVNRWDLVNEVLQEAVRTNSKLRAVDGDRFLRCVDMANVHPFLRAQLGSDRHVLHSACRTAKGAEGKELLLQLLRHAVRSDVESGPDASGRTVSYYAARHSAIAVEILMNLKVDMSSPCKKDGVAKGLTPLMVASRRGNLEAAALLAQRVDLNAQDAAGNTALMHAAAAGQQEVVELLLGVQVDATTTNKRGLSAHHLAAMAGHGNIATPLLQHWNRASAVQSGPTTSLHCAAIGGCTKLVEYLVTSYDTLPVLEADQLHGKSPVYLAYANGHTAALRALLAALQQRTETPSTPIDERIVNNDASLRRYGLLRDVLAIGLSLNGGVEPRGGPAFPSGKGGQETLRSGEQLYAPRVEKFGAKKQPMLLWFARNNCPVGVRACADHNAIDDCCALHVAAAAGHLDVVQLLITLDMSDTDAVDKRGRRALECALECGREQVALFLIQHMPLTIEDATTPQGDLHMNLFHAIASSRCPGVIQAVVTRLTQNAPEGSEANQRVLAALLQEDAEVLTPFDTALLTGCPAMVLRIGAAIQQLASAAGRQVAVPLSAKLMETVPCLSPAVRVVLFDLFGYDDVATSVGFEAKTAKQRRRHGYKRLSFPDVRVIGISSLQRDKACAVVHDHFSVEHERDVFSKLIAHLELPFRFRFQFASIGHLLPNEQAAVLQRLGTSLLAGGYTNMRDTAATRIGSVELAMVRSRSEVSTVVEGSSIVQKFAFSGKGVCVMRDPAQAMEQAYGTTARAKQVEADAALKSVTETIRSGAVHPLIRHLRVSADWSRVSEPPGPQLESACETLLGHRGLGYLVDVAIPRLADAIDGCTEEQIKAVASTSSLSVHAVVFRFNPDLAKSRRRPFSRYGDEDGDGASKSGDAAAPSDIVIDFNGDAMGDVSAALAPIARLVERDAAMVKIHRCRDEFVSTLKAAAGLTYKVKLEVEGAEVSDMPVPLLEEMLGALTDAMSSLTEPERTALERKKHTVSTPAPEQTADALTGGAGADDIDANDTSVLATTSSRLIAASLLQTRAVLILFSTRRDANARRSGNKVTLCFTPTLAPTKADILNALRADTSAMECERLKDQLPSQLGDLAQRLNTYLPSATLVLDMPSIAHRTEPEETAAALALLLHGRSRLVLMALIQGLSVGWDARLGGIIRRHVKQVTVVLTEESRSSLVHLPGGNLVYYASLLCVQRRIPPSLGLLSAQEVASNVIIALEQHASEIVEYVDTKRAFACWCRLQGRSLRRAVAGDARCGFDIVASNIMNRRCAKGQDPFVVMGKSSEGLSLDSIRVNDNMNGRYRVNFAAPTASGTLTLRVSLHGHAVMRSPISVRIAPGNCVPGATTIESKFNSVVVGRPFNLLLRTHDEHGNPCRTSPMAARRGKGAEDAAATSAVFVVEGPTASNLDGITVVGCRDNRDGTFTATVKISKPSRNTSVALRVRDSTTAHVVSTDVEVLSEETYVSVLKVRAGIAIVPEKKKIGGDRVALFFRAAVRELDAKRKERESQEVGDSFARTFPTGCPTTMRGYKKQKAAARKKKAVFS